MVLPLESNLTLIWVFLPWFLHADNLPVLVSIIHWHVTHIHPLLIELRRKKTTKTLIPPAVTSSQKDSSVPSLPSSKVLLLILILQISCPCYFSHCTLGLLVATENCAPHCCCQTCTKSHRDSFSDFQNKRIVKCAVLLKEEDNLTKKPWRGCTNRYDLNPQNSDSCRFHSGFVFIILTYAGIKTFYFEIRHALFPFVFPCEGLAWWSWASSRSGTQLRARPSH